MAANYHWIANKDAWCGGLWAAHEPNRRLLFNFLAAAVAHREPRPDASLLAPTK